MMKHNSVPERETQNKAHADVTVDHFFFPKVESAAPRFQSVNYNSH